MTTLRSLLLEIGVKINRAAIKETDAEFAHATKSAQNFESTLTKSVAQLDQVRQAALRAGSAIRQAFLPNGALPGAPPAPSTGKAAREAAALGMPAPRSGPRPPSPGDVNMAAPDLAAFAPPSTAARFRAFLANSSAGLRKLGSDFTSAKGSGVSLGATIEKLSAGMFAFGVAGGLAANAVRRTFAEVIDFGGALDDASKRTRLSAETLQVWSQLAKLNGADLGNVEGGFRKLSRAMNMASNGSKLQAAAFKELGVKVKDDVTGQLRPAEEVMLDVGGALNGLEDDAKATALATQILGPNGLALIPIFADGADAVRKQSAALRENVALSQEEVARLDAVGDSLTTSGGKWTALKTRLVVELLPVIEKVVDWLGRSSKWLLETAKSGRVLQTLLGGLAGAGFLKVLTVLGPWILKLTGAKNAIGAFGFGLRAATSAMLRFLLPALAIEDFLVFLAGGKSVFGRALEEIFGSGGAKKGRDEILAFFASVQKFASEIGPLLKPLAEIFGSAVKAAAEAFLAVLNLIGLSLADGGAKADQLGDRLVGNMNRVSDAVAGTIGKIRELIGLGSGSGGEKEEVAVDSLKGGRRASWGNAIGDALGLGSFAQAQDENANRAARARVSPVGRAATVPGSSSGGAKVIHLSDQRTINVDVVGGASPGATGRATATAVDGALTKDRRQTLDAVSG